MQTGTLLVYIQHMLQTFKGFKYILIATCNVTNFVIAVPVKSIHAL